MNTETFMKKALENIAQVVHDKHGLAGLSPEQIQLVWFNHTLGFKKALFYCPAAPDIYIEVTYNRDSESMYIDVYNKISNTAIYC